MLTPGPTKLSHLKDSKINQMEKLLSEKTKEGRVGLFVWMRLLVDVEECFHMGLLVVCGGHEVGDDGLELGRIGVEDRSYG